MIGEKSPRSEPVRPRNNFISSKGLCADQVVDGETQAQEETIACGLCQPEEEETMEARAPKIANRPRVPTQAEIDAHFPLHAEFRD